MEGWKEIRFKELISDMGDGGTPSTVIDGNFGGNIPWVVVDDVKPEIYSTKDSLTEQGYKSCSAKMWKEGTIILTTGATIGKVGIAMVPLCTKQGITGIVCNEYANNLFIRYWLEANAEYLLRYAQGTTFKEIRIRPLGNLRIMVPKPFTKESVEEQTAIANILSKIDEAITSVQNSIAAAERLKKSLMQNLLTGRMKPDGTLRKDDEFYVDEKFGKVPVGWEVKRVDEISERKTDVIDPTKTKEIYDYIGLEHIIPDEFTRWGKGLSNETVALKVKFEKGDLLYGKLRPYLNKVFISDISGVGSTEFIVLKQNEFTNWVYLNFQLQRFLDYTKSMTAGTQHPRASWKDIKHYLLCVPKDNQEKESIEKKLLYLEHYKKDKQNKIATLERLKKSLMQNLLTGKVRLNY